MKKALKSKSSGSDNFQSLENSSESFSSSEDSEDARVDLTYKNCLWTRVVAGTADLQSGIPLYQLKEDLKSLDTAQNTIVRGRPRQLKKYFDPEEYHKENEPLERGPRELTLTELGQFQLRVDQIQEIIRERAVTAHLNWARATSLSEDAS